MGQQAQEYFIKRLSCYTIGRYVGRYIAKDNFLLCQVLYFSKQIIRSINVLIDILDFSFRSHIWSRQGMVRDANTTVTHTTEVLF